MDPEEIEGRLDTLMEEFTDVIERVGWAAVGVFAASHDDASFSYTIGLTETLQHPELIIYGVHYQQAHSILACAIDLIKEKELLLTPGEKYQGIVSKYPILIRDVADPASRPLNMATRYYGHPVMAVQLVWPDESGLFPGDEGCEETVVTRQEQRPE